MAACVFMRVVHVQMYQPCMRGGLRIGHRVRRTSDSGPKYMHSCFAHCRERQIVDDYCRCSSHVTSNHHMDHYRIPLPVHNMHSTVHLAESAQIGRQGMSSWTRARVNRPCSRFRPWCQRELESPHTYPWARKWFGSGEQEPCQKRGRGRA